MICCIDKPGELAAPADGQLACLAVNRARLRGKLTAVSRLHRLIRDRAVDVVVSHNLAAQHYAGAACLGTRAAHVHVEHGTNPHFRGLKNRLRTAVLNALTDRTVAVSKGTATELARQHGQRRDRLIVIPNGIAMREISDEQRETMRRKIRVEFNVPQDALVVGSVGRLAEVKGYDRLIAAIAAMRVQRSTFNVQRSMIQAFGKDDLTSDTRHLAPQPRVQSSFLVHLIATLSRLHLIAPLSRFRSATKHIGTPALPPSLPPFPHHSNTPPLQSLTLLLIGDGPERAALERQAADLGIADRVVFAGYRNDARDLLAAMDLFVLPSRGEGLSIALLEAMAEGVPVMVTDVGESRAVIDNGKAGVVLPTDERDWGRVISEQLAAIGGAEMGVRVRRARERVRVHYSLDATLDAYERVYEDVLRRGI